MTKHACWEVLAENLGGVRGAVIPCHIELLGVLYTEVRAHVVGVERQADVESLVAVDLLIVAKDAVDVGGVELVKDLDLGALGPDD